jgi:hypothetical protein
MTIPLILFSYEFAATKSTLEDHFLCCLLLSGIIESKGIHKLNDLSMFPTL